MSLTITLWWSSDGLVVDSGGLVVDSIHDGFVVDGRWLRRKVKRDVGMLEKATPG